MTQYRGSYVVERQKDDDEWEVLLSVSGEASAESVIGAYDHLLTEVSAKIEMYRPMLETAEDDPEPIPVEVVPNSPTIRSVDTQKEN